MERTMTMETAEAPDEFYGDGDEDEFIHCSSFDN
jgi:hypothetical protein